MIGQTAHVNEMIRGGSLPEELKNGALAASAIEWFDIQARLPRMKIFFPLDSIEIVNNSAQNIVLYLNAITDPYTIPAYMVKPITGKAFNRFGIKNDGTVAIAAGEIIIHIKRLPS